MALRSVLADRLALALARAQRIEGKGIIRLRIDRKGKVSVFVDAGAFPASPLFLNDIEADFQGNLFSGSKALLAIADELRTIDGVTIAALFRETVAGVWHRPRWRYVALMLAVMDPFYIMGSMGSVVGEKVTRAIERLRLPVARKRAPLSIFAGARLAASALGSSASRCAASRRASGRSRSCTSSTPRSGSNPPTPAQAHSGCRERGWTVCASSASSFRQNSWIL